MAELLTSGNFNNMITKKKTYKMKTPVANIDGKKFTRPDSFMKS